MYYIIWNCHNIVLILRSMARSLKHIEVDTLPANAVKVAQYAKDRNCSTSLIYHELERGKASFKIVIWQGFNFVIPE